MRGRLRRCLPLIASVALLSAGVCADEPETPDRVPGLVAWYKVETLLASQGDGSRVRTWADASGHGHDLTSEKDSRSATLSRNRINGQPALVVDKGHSYAVTDPFELGDHTIFLVYRTGSKDRVLLRSDVDEAKGIVLHAEKRTHVFRSGDLGKPVHAYTTFADLVDEPHLTVLGREGEVLRAFVDGIETSSAGRLTEPVKVGEFFRIAYTRYVDGDGKGLQIAEMIFYDRFLTRQEREAVSDYLVDKYSLKLLVEVPLAERLDRLSSSPQAGIVRLNATKETAIGDEGAVIAWDPPERADPPFRYDAGEESWRLSSTRDATRVRVYVSIPFEATSPGTEARVLLLRNGEFYHPEDGRSASFGGPGAASKTTVELEATLFLDEGDFFEVTAVQQAGPKGSLKALGGGLLVGEAK